MGRDHNAKIRTEIFLRIFISNKNEYNFWKLRRTWYVKEGSILHDYDKYVLLHSFSIHWNTLQFHSEYILFYITFVPFLRIKIQQTLIISNIYIKYLHNLSEQGGHTLFFFSYCVFAIYIIKHVIKPIHHRNHNDTSNDKKCRIKLKFMF